MPNRYTISEIADALCIPERTIYARLKGKPAKRYRGYARDHNGLLLIECSVCGSLKAKCEFTRCPTRESEVQERCKSCESIRKRIKRKWARIGIERRSNFPAANHPWRSKNAFEFAGLTRGG